MSNINDFNFTISQTVAWGDMDAFQHVNNVMYFRYMETSRIEYLKKVGYMRGGIGGDIGPILAETTCKYILPLEYPDTIQVGLKVNKIGNTSMVFEHALFSPKVGLAATGIAVVVCYDYEKGEKVSLPENIRQAIEKLEERKF